MKNKKLFGIGLITTLLVGGAFVGLNKTSNFVKANALEGPVYTILEARTQVGKDQVANIKGVVYAMTNVGNEYVYLADENGNGLVLDNLSKNTDKTLIDNFHIGDEVVINGMQSYRLGTSRYIVGSTLKFVETLSTSNTVSARELNNSTKLYDYVAVDNATFIELREHPTKKNHVQAIFDNNGKELQVYLNFSDKGTEFGKAFMSEAETWTPNVTKVNLAGPYGKEETKVDGTKIYTDRIELVEGTTYEVVGAAPLTEQEKYAKAFINELHCDATGSKAPSVEEWAALKTKFELLSAEDQLAFTNATTTETDLVSKAVAKYDYIVTKYGSATYENFMNRALSDASNIINYNSSNIEMISIIVVISLLAVTSIGFIAIKKRKYLINK